MLPLSVRIFPAKTPIEPFIVGSTRYEPICELIEPWLAEGIGKICRRIQSWHNQAIIESDVLNQRSSLEHIQRIVAIDVLHFVSYPLGDINNQSIIDDCDSKVWHIKNRVVFELESMPDDLLANAMLEIVTADIAEFELALERLAMKILL